jgi:hypothetical protein
MAEFCGECYKKMGSPSAIYEFGDFQNLAKGLRKGEEARVLCEGCGWIIYKKVGYDNLVVVDRKKY